MDKSSFVIDQVRRVILFDGADSAARFNLTQLEDVTVKATVDGKEIPDALGAPLMELQRAKKLAIDGKSSVFDLGLLAAQYGDEITDSTDAATITTPSFEVYTYNSTSAATYALKHEIASAKLGTGIQKFIYKLNADGTVKSKIEYAATADATHFSMATASGTTTLTPPAGSTDGDVLLITYEYEADAADHAVRVVDKASAEAANGRMMMEVLFRDICQKTTVYYGFVVCDNAQIDGNIDLSLTPDGKHSFSAKCMTSYCGANSGNLVTFIIPDAEAAA